MDFLRELFSHQIAMINYDAFWHCMKKVRQIAVSYVCLNRIRDTDSGNYPRKYNSSSIYDVVDAIQKLSRQ